MPPGRMPILTRTLSFFLKPHSSFKPSQPGGSASAFSGKTVAQAAPEDTAVVDARNFAAEVTPHQLSSTADRLVGRIAGAEEVDIEVHPDFPADRTADAVSAATATVTAAAAGFGNGQHHRASTPVCIRPSRRWWLSFSTVAVRLIGRKTTGSPFFPELPIWTDLSPTSWSSWKMISSSGLWLVPFSISATRSSVGHDYRKTVGIESEGCILQRGDNFGLLVEVLCFFESTFKEYSLVGRWLPSALLLFLGR